MDLHATSRNLLMNAKLYSRSCQTCYKLAEIKSGRTQLFKCFVCWSMVCSECVEWHDSELSINLYDAFKHEAREVLDYVRCLDCFDEE